MFIRLDEIKHRDRYQCYSVVHDSYFSATLTSSGIYAIIEAYSNRDIDIAIPLKLYMRQLNIQERRTQLYNLQWMSRHSRSYQDEVYKYYPCISNYVERLKWAGK